MLWVFIKNEAILLNGEIDSLKAKQIELSQNYHTKKSEKTKNKLALSVSLIPC